MGLAAEKGQPWEKLASLDLRHGHTSVIDTYLAHGRIRYGDTETMTDAAYTAWRRADRDAGRITVLIAETREQVTALNERARADLLIDQALTQDRKVELRDGSHAGIGDIVITRRNDRKIAAPSSHAPTLAGRRRALCARWRGATAAEHGIQVEGRQRHLLVEVCFTDLLQSFFAAPGRPLGLTDLPVADHVRCDVLEGNAPVVGDGPR